MKPTAATYLRELYLRGTSSYKVQRDWAGRGTGVFSLVIGSGMVTSRVTQESCAGWIPNNSRSIVTHRDTQFPRVV